MHFPHYPSANLRIFARFRPSLKFSGRRNFSEGLTYASMRKLALGLCFVIHFWLYRPLPCAQKAASPRSAVSPRRISGRCATEADSAESQGARSLDSSAALFPTVDDVYGRTSGVPRSPTRVFYLRACRNASSTVLIAAYWGTQGWSRTGPSARASPLPALLRGPQLCCPHHCEL